MSNACQRAEVLAGAIALHEAGDVERDEYRSHIAVCSSCLGALGGEIGIERVMETIREAREGETWQPVLASIHSKNERRLRALMRFGFSTAGIAIAASLAMHFLVATNLGPIAASPANPIVLDYDGTHITLEPRTGSHALKARTVAAVVAPAPHLVVVHNVITLKSPSARTEVTHSANSDLKSTTTVVGETTQPQVESQSDIPIWRRSAPLPVTRAAAEKISFAPLRLEGRAESIALAPSQTVRDVAPLGGESAINPQPPLIAYSEGAEGTTAFAVNVDERGIPVKCAITQSSGSVVLDEAVCKAAMKARFSPRLVNGRPTASIYHDAFTFRNATNNDGIQDRLPY
ncbi:MAG: energy transducer TonB [Candidatus Eremiobacteraeota bacterium]|nr:energy transducer TonB [Candidatus Eremiobacteraeota bacterium]